MAHESGSGSAFRPFVPPEQDIPEFTPKAIILGIFFGVFFGAATVYLALRAGLTVSASVPIAVLAIAVFKKLGKSTILENNIVQTIGSAGESVAAGVVFTLPALLFLADGKEYFHYLTVFVLAVIGGTLGVLFMIPAPPRAHRQGARQAQVPGRRGLRRRPHCGREGRRSREDGVLGSLRGRDLQVSLRNPRALARNGDVVPHRQERPDSGRDALLRRDTRVPGAGLHHRPAGSPASSPRAACCPGSR